MRILLLLALVCCGNLTGLAQGDSSPAKKPDVWEPLRFLVGRWEGVSTGKSGEGKSERDYRFVLNGRFLHFSNRSVYPPQPQNKKGETHEDIGYVSYDRAKKQFVLRQFHIEGFVNTYAQVTVADDGKTIVFTADTIENIAPGWRARETYRVTGADEFTELFELAEPGKDFAVYSEAKFKRVR